MESKTSLIEPEPLDKISEQENVIIEEILAKLYTGQQRKSRLAAGITGQEKTTKMDNAEGSEKLNVEINVDYPIELRHDKTMGRCLQAKRDIEPGEVILNDWPIITAPNANAVGESPTNGETCLGCCLIRRVEEMKECPKCKWPVCSDKCANIPQHADFECKVFSEKHITPNLSSPYNLIAPQEYIKILRCLLLRDDDDPKRMAKWKQILSLEAHMDIRRNIPRVKLMSRLVKRFVRSLCKFEEFDEATIDFVLGVVDVNAFRHSYAPEPLKPIKNPVEVDEPVRNATFLYPQASMAAHGCVRNTDWRTLAGGQLEMRAPHKILKGEIIIHAYVDLMLGTPERRRLLRNLFYFDCACQRCSDPTELNTHFSTLKCTKCTGGYLLPEKPLEYTSPWRCGDCNHVEPYQYEQDLVQRIFFEEKEVCSQIPFKTNLQTVKALMKILKAHKDVTLHPNHYRLVNIEYILVRHLLKMPKPAKEIMLEIKRIVTKYMKLSSVFHPSTLDD